jgi:hypothetical protein
MGKDTFSPQYKFVADTIRRRILNGDYSLKTFPSERRLAAELGVNYMTVRRGLHILEDENILIRQTNRRMAVKRAQQGNKPHLNFGFLTPTFNSGTVEFWRLTIERQVAKLPCNVRPILYMHWDDPILIDSLKGFDGIFLNPIPEEVPPAIIETFRQQEHPVIILDGDFSSYGVPSIQLFIPSFIQKLLNHLEETGHTKIGCVNTQPSCREVNERINQWRYWMSAHGLTGHLIDDPVEPHNGAAEHAYKIMSQILGDPQYDETAWLCITTPAAIGTMRAMLDHGIQPGKDKAICAINGDNIASLLNPPLTALEPVDPSPYISFCLNWMMKGGKNWKGPLLMNPVDIPLVIRESTCPDIQKQRQQGILSYSNANKNGNPGNEGPGAMESHGLGLPNSNGTT